MSFICFLLSLNFHLDIRCHCDRLFSLFSDISRTINQENGCRNNWLLKWSLIAALSCLFRWCWHSVHICITVLCFSGLRKNPNKRQSVWIASKPHSHNSFNEASERKRRKWVHVMCVLVPAWVRLRKWKTEEKERKERGKKEGWDRGSRCREWKAGWGKVEGRWGRACVWESGNRRWSCIPAASSRLGTNTLPPRLQPPSNSLTMAQTDWQGSKALPLNHIKVSLALHWKSI